MNATPFKAPDQLAPHTETVRAAIEAKPGSTVPEIQKACSLGENIVRAALERLASQNALHCTLRGGERRRGSRAREYRPGPLPITVEPRLQGDA